MNATKIPEAARFAVEPERYELRSTPLHDFALDRRSFFKVLGAAYRAVFSVAARVSEGQESGGRSQAEALPSDIGSWLHVGADGKVTVFTGKAEIGQNIRTSLAQAVAGELRVPFESVEMVMADTALTPYDMGTFGSRTTPYMSPQLRRVASAARDLLVHEAAKEWNVPPEKLLAGDGKVMEKNTFRSVTYAKLAEGKTLAQELPEADPITPPAEWNVAGSSLAKVNAREFVTGKHRFTPDLRPKGMLHGKVLRPPAFEAALESYDDSAAKSVPGVAIVRDGDFIGAAAQSEAAAEKALGTIRAEWRTTPQPSNAGLFAYLKANTEPSEDSGDRAEKGSIDAGMKEAEHPIERTYTVQYIAHAPLEPRAAVAEWADGKLTVWTGTQRPFGVRDALADAFRISKDQIRVIVPDTGSAYGGKHTPDAALEAARLARAAGKPVKVVWTREEEFTWAYFRPAGVIEVKAGTGRDGKLTAWEFHNYNSGGSGIETPYDCPNQKIEFHPVRSPLRQGSYRGLAATANFFARESSMDELAHAVRIDPLEFRLKNLSDRRLRGVFEAASKAFGWPATKTKPGQGFGIGGGFEKNSYVATCAEVLADLNSGEVRVVRMVTAFDCGAIVNPDGLRNQVAGAAIMGLGGALFEAIQFANGKIENPHFASYRVPRFRDVPEIDVVLLNHKDIPPAGAGETPIMGVAPAIGNALFDASGKRSRSLPMVPQGLKSLSGQRG